jgi:hypothetical protein
MARRGAVRRLAAARRALAAAAPPPSGRRPLGLGRLDRGRVHAREELPHLLGGRAAADRAEAGLLERQVRLTQGS